MKFPKKTPFTYSNLHGKPLGGVEGAETDASARAAAQLLAQRVAAMPPEAVERVFDALTLAGWHRGKSALTQLMRGLGWTRPDGGFYSVADVGAALLRLAQEGRAAPLDGRVGEVWTIAPGHAEKRLAALLADASLVDGWRVWLWASGAASGPVGVLPRHFSPRNRDEAQAVLRWVLSSGIGLNGYRELARGPLESANVVGAVLAALSQLLRIGLFERVDAPLRWALIESLDHAALLAREPPLLAWAHAHLHEAPAGCAGGLRLRLAERCLHRADREGMLALLADVDTLEPFKLLLSALLPAVRGEFANVAADFPAVWKSVTGVLGMRRGIAPMSLLQWYPLALLAHADASSWTTARKFCVAQSGSRQPEPSHDWGRWAHAVAVRLGDERLDAQAFAAPQAWEPIDAEPDVLADRVVLAAWVGQAPARPWSAPQLQTLTDELLAQGLAWKADLVMQACQKLGWAVPERRADAPAVWPVAFFATRQDSWREALAAMTALGDQRAAKTAKPEGTLNWQLTLDEESRMADLGAFEPPRSARSKPKPVTLLQLKKMAHLDPRDAAVARCLRQGPYGQSDLTLDIAQAALALVGHPAVSFSDAPDTMVELVESLPTLEVLRERSPQTDGRAGAQAQEAEHFVFRLNEPLLPVKPPSLKAHAPSSHELREAEVERRNGLRIVRETPQRARLIRVTPAQRRVAELVSQRWAVPASAQAELDAALRVLSAHFIVHSDADSGEPVLAEARLLARLQPKGEGLQLTLLVRPFGAFGPTAVPGVGRDKWMTPHQGRNLSTIRDLAVERAHLDSVTERLPFLLGDDGMPLDGTWRLDEPEQALACVHELGQLVAEGRAVRALEWPQGKPVRVVSAESKGLSLKLSSQRGWFDLHGELVLDEGRVLSLQQLLALLREHQGSRFVPLGEGQYLRLADQLRQRLADLDALGERKAESLRITGMASAWLADAASELGIKGDAAWRRQAAALAEAAASQPSLPAGLQAELRPYQLEGFAWMMRLAQAGFGAILADDMGLGKTVQTLAVLLARAGAGPALVVAPTSVCDNWVEEARRFTPALSASVYGHADSAPRQEHLTKMGPGDVLVVSYALLLRDADRFAAMSWNTLVLDEAQALKNAATQRVHAVAVLQAGFRLALSGTPVENRLGDVWSIMNLINPGLLGSANRFTERFVGPIERQHDEVARSRLRRLVSPFLLRRTKAQVLTDLPPRTEIVQRIETSADESAFLEAMRREALARISELQAADTPQSRFNVLAELTRLRRAACDPRLVGPELGRVGSKVQAFERLAGELAQGHHQALVFSQFTDFLKLLAQQLDAAGLRYQYLDGSTPAAARSERVAAFQRGESDFFLISLKAGGFGLNLTAADYVVITDPWWNPAAEDQAMGRAHRIGQRRPVTVYRLVTAGSIEERIVSLHQGKRALADGLLAEQDGTAPLDASELISLLRDED
jgi:superfamily II DNA or RNA helicase